MTPTDTSPRREASPAPSSNPTLRWVCVFCGSSAGEDSRYLDAATRLGKVLLEREIGLVYGGSRVGLMGRLADTVLGGGGEVVGVIPRALMDREVAHHGLTELLVTDSMHARKSEMVERSDAFVAAPGGIGTLEEFFEVLTWAQLGLHRKPCGLLNARGYFDPLIHLLDHAVREGFVQKAHRSMVLVEADPAPLLDRISGYDPPRVPRWIRPGET
jgi:uncharacterized protein (TIGR00730 family)